MAVASQFDENALDWWSKYFASVDTFNEVKKQNIIVADFLILNRPFAHKLLDLKSYREKFGDERNSDF